jgi:hypothetical protein
MIEYENLSQIHVADEIGESIIQHPTVDTEDLDEEKPPSKKRAVPTAKDLQIISDIKERMQEYFVEENNK